MMRGLTGLLGTVALSAQLWSSLSMAQKYKPADVCSDINTAGSGSGNFSLYQSHGLCGDFCRNAEYAYAVMNYQECWCSDYTPEKSTVVDDDECNTKCPGYDEWCGGSHVYGYLQLGKKPKGTKGATPDEETSGVATVTATDGGVRTITITPTNGADAAGAAKDAEKKGLSGGAIAGIVIGVLLLIVAIIAAVWFMMRRKRAQAEEDSGAFDPRSSNSTAFTGMGPEMKEPGAAGAAGAAGNRNSRLLPVDPRMDPFSQGIYVRTKSRESINTLHDDQDYSRRVHEPRVLRAMNPDPVEH